MKILVKNLGPLKQAEFELGDLTIICGHNNTGKTYATYSVFGFLSEWKKVFSIRVPENNIHQLLTEGVTELDIQTFVNDAQNILKEGCKSYTKLLPKIFASSSNKFSESDFQVHLNTSDIQPVSKFERTISATKSQLFFISKKQDKFKITISLLVSRQHPSVGL